MIKELTDLSKPLPIEYIDFRVQSINKGGYATILAYKDARVDMKVLDEICGVGYWQKKYEIVNDNLFCSVGVYNKELKEWIWKQDVGTESNTEKEKGQASDAFKRACFNLGIGRELYDYPLIQVKLLDNEFDKTTNKTTWDFKLKEWIWVSKFENNTIIELIGTDNNGKVRFNYKKGAKVEKPKDDTAEISKLLESSKTLEELQTNYKSLSEANQKKFATLTTAIKAKLSQPIKQ